MIPSLKITAIRTDIFHTGESLNAFISAQLKDRPMTENSILAVTSKIVSLAERRIVPREGVDKAKLILTEADHDLGEVAFGCRLTIKHGLFIASAGIDESNSEDGSYILYPEDPFASARALWEYLRNSYKIKNIGVLLTDSHTTPLRQGVTGAALSYWGFQGVKSMIGESDIFGRELKMTKLNLADGLAASAVLMMGEGAERCPLALIENAPVTFQDETRPEELAMAPVDDMYYPIYADRLR